MATATAAAAAAAAAAAVPATAAAAAATAAAAAAAAAAAEDSRFGGCGENFERFRTFLAVLACFQTLWGVFKRLGAFSGVWERFWDVFGAQIGSTCVYVIC